MKVLYSCLSRSWGGMEMFALTAAQKLVNRGIETDFLCYPGSKIEDEAKKRGFNLIISKSSGYFHPVNVYRLAQIIKVNEYDLIHTQASKDLWILSPALSLVSSKIPLFFTKQMGSYVVKKDLLHKLIYKRVTTVFAISKVIERNLLETCPLKQNQVKLLHNAVDTKIFNPDLYDKYKVRNEFNIDNDTILIGMLARFSQGKGHEEFLEAARSLNQKHKNLAFIIVGEASHGEDEYDKSIKKLCSDLRLTNKVIFTGFRSDTTKVLAAMDIFAFPSHNEAFGIALAEALSMGLPSVASNSDGVLDIAVDHSTSYLFEKKNAVDLASKLELLINSPNKREEFGKAARKRAIEHFDIELLTDKVIDFYNETLKSKL